MIFNVEIVQIPNCNPRISGRRNRFWAARLKILMAERILGFIQNLVAFSFSK
jgi:hypothetical protein